MKNKIVVLILLLTIALTSVRIAEAAPTAPTITCQISGKVLKVEQINRTVQESGQPWSGPITYYSVNLDILDISTYSMTGLGACDDLYAKYLEESGLIYFLEDYNKTPIKEGQTIKAIVNSRGDEWFSGNFLGILQILQDAPAGISIAGVNINPLYIIIPGVIAGSSVIIFILLKRKRKY
jgi:hypothetical protein